MKQAIWWWLSAATSAILIAVLVQLWSVMNRYEVELPAPCVHGSSPNLWTDTLHPDPTSMQHGLA